ncbi:hypothetical protein J6590_078250 [Homalodisca vitripennis]|nr:hypothetical protein J6590_078250 [Homalodisca vitripennis]
MIGSPCGSPLRTLAAGPHTVLCTGQIRSDSANRSARLGLPINSNVNHRPRPGPATATTLRPHSIPFLRQSPTSPPPPYHVLLICTFESRRGSSLLQQMHQQSGPSMPKKIESD